MNDSLILFIATIANLLAKRFWRKKMINKDNFFTQTYGAFTPCDPPLRDPDYTSYVKKFVYPDGAFDSDVFDIDAEPVGEPILTDSDEVSSRYWYTEDGVYRRSNHWRKVAKCRWALPTYDPTEYFVVLTGFCRWNDFKRIKTHRVSELKDGTYTAVCFDRIEECVINAEARRNSTPLINHPNHYSDWVDIIIQTDPTV